MSSNEKYRKVMRLLPGDEKRIELAEKGIFFLDEIDEISSYTTTLQFLYNDMFMASTPIWIVLNSPGGEVAHGFAVFDVIKALASNGREVNVLGIGHVASMATAIMQAGTKRYSLPNTQFLVHQIRQTIIQTEEVNESRERVQEMDRINNIVMKIIADRAGISLDELKTLSEKKDYWLDAEGAKNLGSNGLIDEVTIGLPF